MRIGSKKWIPILGTGMMLLLAPVAPWSTTNSLPAGGKYTPHPLTNASPAEVAQLAVLITENRFRVLRGTPEVLLARRVTKQDIAAAGLGCIDFAGQDPLLMLVVVKGDFDASNLPGIVRIQPFNHVHYIAITFDLWAGQPTYYVTSPRGGGFRRLLNDPTLPDDVLLGPNDEPMSSPVHRTETEEDISCPSATGPVAPKPPYGSTAIPVAGPSR